MEVTLTPIGNSQGIRIPQAILKQCGFADTVTLTVKKRSIILSPAQPRRTWAESFAKTPPSENQLQPLRDIPNQFDHTDWQW